MNTLSFTFDTILAMCLCIAIFIGVFCFGMAIGRQSIKTFLLFTKNMTSEEYSSYVTYFNKSTFRYFKLGIIHILGAIVLLILLYLL